MSGPSLPVVIIPVFNAFSELADCLASIDAVSPDAGVLLINDASSDQRVQPLLESWVAGKPWRSLLSNTRNRGFVYSANLGMTSAEGDVILLNSDTIVTSGWIEALSACLASDDLIATATPWSNNGEIVSMPEFCVPAPLPRDASKIASIIRSTGTPLYPEIPTAVGFCMAISRTAIDRIGLFDEATFGRGYGEENDFCMRARMQGLRNVLCDDAYVAHVGGRSFAPLGLKSGSESMARLLGKHPSYQALVETFISTDPLAERRQVLVAAIQRRRAGIS